MRYVTAKEMKEMDALAVEKHGVLTADLMENAGRAVAEEVMKVLKGGSVAIFCGYGNNGGDGFVTAKYLFASGYDTSIFLIGKEKSFSSEAGANYDTLMELKSMPVKITDEKYLETVFGGIGKPDLIVDAIFGIGMKGGLDNFYIKLFDKINSMGSPIISVDVPSGLDSDTGLPQGAAIRAKKTVTFGCPKIGFKNPKAKTYLGDVVVADIGLAPCRIKR